jgi:hypothetical protein
LPRNSDHAAKIAHIELGLPQLERLVSMAV